MSKKLYASHAERQRAYRARLKAQQLTPHAAPVTPAPPHKPKRGPSRPARLLAIEMAIRDLQQELERWQERLPPALADAEIGERLQEAIDEFDSVADSLAGIVIPRGYGRD